MTTTACWTSMIPVHSTQTCPAEQEFQRDIPEGVNLTV
jgi:hypothetical protein